MSKELTISTRGIEMPESPIRKLAPLAYINISWILWQRMRVSKGHELNPILGKTAVTMFLLSVCLLVAFATA